jgi:hypothetical protein
MIDSWIVNARYRHGIEKQVKFTIPFPEAEVSG